MEIASTFDTDLAVAGQSIPEFRGSGGQRRDLVDHGFGLRLAQSTLDGGSVKDVDLKDGGTEPGEMLEA